MSGPYSWVVENIVPTDKQIAMAQLERQAALGDIDAQYQLGVVYAEGQLVPGDPTRAELMVPRGSRTGAFAIPNHGCAPAFLSIRGDPRSSLDAAGWCERASDQGDAEAAFRLANLYAKGEGVERDRAAANRLYQAAAEAGHSQAQIIVGLDYADDGNIPIDLVQAYRWLTVVSASDTPGRDLTDVVELREHLKTRLTADQLVEARRMVLEGQRDVSSYPSQ